MSCVSKIFTKQFWTTERVIEAIAVASSFLYTLLYIKGNPWCWLFAFVGAAFFTYLCYVRKILAESFLQLFYVAMAIYGFLTMENEWQTNVWSWQLHAIWLSIGTAGMLGCFLLLKKFSDAEMPLEDSFTTVFSLVATWVMVNYVHENYLYWIIIDAVSIHLYWKRELYFGSALFIIYTIMVTAGYFGWM